MLRSLYGHTMGPYVIIIGSDSKKGPVLNFPVLKSSTLGQLAYHSIMHRSQGSEVALLILMCPASFVVGIGSLQGLAGPNRM